MVRDFELIRKILLLAESNDHGYINEPLEIDGYTEEQVGYHIHLMGQAGLAETVDTSTNGSPSPSALFISMTWEGYDFLALTKEKTVWNRAKKTILKTGEGVAFPIAVDLLKEAVQAHWSRLF